MQQISLFPSVDEKEIQTITIKELKNYRALKVKLENQLELKETGLTGIFPTLRNMDKANELVVRQIDRALTCCLDPIERHIIEMKYLNTDDFTDLNIYLNLGIKKGKYYAKKKTAIYNIATALGII